MNQLKNQDINFNKFYTKATLLQGVDVSRYVLLSADKDVNSGHKIFFRLPITPELIQLQMRTLLSTNRNMYEILIPNQPVKPYFDLEMEYEGLTKDICEKNLQLFIHWLVEEIHTLYNITLTTEDMIILDSCRANKLSYHSVIQNKICFQNIEKHKIFVQYLWFRFQNPLNDEENTTMETLTWYFKEASPRKIFDPVPYSSFQSFRLVNQSKKGKPYILKNTSMYRDEDTFVRLYTGIEGREILNVESLVLAINNEKKKTQQRRKKKDSPTNIILNASSIKKNTTTISTDTEFQPHGRTLMTEKKLKYEDLDKLPKRLQFLYLIPGDSQSFQTYMKIVFAYSGIKGKKEEFVEWAKLYPTYDDNDPLIRGFDSFRSTEAGGETPTYGYPLLKRYAQLAHPEYFNRASYLLREYFNPPKDRSTPLIRTIRETCPFLSMEETEFEDDIMAPEKILILHAYLGKGKTTAIKRLLLREKYQRMLFLSPRIAFSKFITKEFNGHCYIDEKELTSDILVMSMESLHRLHDISDFDCIIFDECEPNLGVFSSSTMKERQVRTYNVFNRLIRNSRKFIMATAFLTSKTIDFAKSFDIPICLIHNTSPPPRRVAMEIHPDFFNERLYQSIRNGEKNYVVWCSLSNMLQFIDELKGGARENNYLRQVVQNMLVYHSKVDSDLVFDTLHNINENWGKASLVMTSPSITVGNSYSPPDMPPDFHNVWINGYPSCAIPDTFQGHMRVRHLMNNIMYFSLPSEKILKLNEKSVEIVFRILQEYDQFTDEKREVIIHLVEELMEKISKSNNSKQNTDGLKAIATSMREEYVVTPCPLRQILMQNLKEQALSKKYYRQMFLQFLQICNYRIEGHENQPNAEACDDRRTEAREEFQTNGGTEDLYDMIKIITEEEAGRIQQLIQRKQSTRIEKLQLSRFYFDKTIDPTLPVEAKCIYFEKFNDNYEKPKLRNALLEATKSVTDYTRNKMMNKNTGAEIIDLSPAKLYYIRELNRRLGITYSCINGTIIPREKIEAMTEYLIQEWDTIHFTFGIKTNPAPATSSSRSRSGLSFKSLITLLRNVYKSWTGVQFVVNRSNKGKKTVLSYVMSNIHYYINRETNDPTILPPPYQIVSENDIEKKAIETQERNEIRIKFEEEEEETDKHGQENR